MRPRYNGAAVYKAKSLDHKILVKVTYICKDLNFGVTQNQYLKYQINPWNSLQNIRQNHWSMKIRSQWP